MDGILFISSLSLGYFRSSQQIGWLIDFRFLIQTTWSTWCPGFPSWIPFASTGLLKNGLIGSWTKEMCTQASLRQLESRMHYDSQFFFCIFQPCTHVHVCMSVFCVVFLYKPCAFHFFNGWLIPLPAQVSELTNSVLCRLIPLFCPHRDMFWSWQSKLVCNVDRWAKKRAKID